MEYYEVNAIVINLIFSIFDRAVMLPTYWFRGWWIFWFYSIGYATAVFLLVQQFAAQSC